MMGDPMQASNAWAMGNLGLSTALRDNAADVDSYDVEDLGEPLAADPWWIRLRGKAIRWSLVAAVFLAYANHWPGGH